MTKREHMSSISSLTKDISEEHQKNTYLSPCKAWQNKVVSWDGRQPCRWIQDGTDFSTPGHQRHLSNIPNAIQDTLPSPAKLKTWSKHPLVQCFHCGYNCCTMLHNYLQLLLVLCLTSTGNLEVGSWRTVHTSHPPTQLKMGNLLRPK